MLVKRFDKTLSLVFAEILTLIISAVNRITKIFCLWNPQGLSAPDPDQRLCLWTLSSNSCYMSIYLSEN